MTINQLSAPPGAIRFPTSRDVGAFPFPTSDSVEKTEVPGEEQPEELTEEELRLMADTMPGDGPGD